MGECVCVCVQVGDNFAVMGKKYQTNVGGDEHTKTISHIFLTVFFLPVQTMTCTAQIVHTKDAQHPDMLPRRQYQYLLQEVIDFLALFQYLFKETLKAMNFI